MFDTLSYLGGKLNETQVLWGVGASMLLNCYGLVDKPNDIDILVSINDIKKADGILKSIGKKKRCENADVYSTEYFCKFVINGVDVDVIAGWTIDCCNCIYEYIFDYNSISQIRKINGVDIPFMCLEDWYVLYQLMPNREFKVNMIEKYLLQNGINRPDLLEKALKGNLPKAVSDRIKAILK